MLTIYVNCRYLLPDHVGPCHLRISFSAHNDLNVKFQSHRSRYLVVTVREFLLLFSTISSMSNMFVFRNKSLQFNENCSC